MGYDRPPFLSLAYWEMTMPWAAKEGYGIYGISNEYKAIVAKHVTPGEFYFRYEFGSDYVSG